MGVLAGGGAEASISRGLGDYLTRGDLERVGADLALVEGAELARGKRDLGAVAVAALLD